ncbi:MAG TPA: hypothetical protein VK419_02665, partial [Bryobacteraceae bacterium]|nr:hypothetical protein [Bryobacteraceae bacterium]
LVPSVEQTGPPPAADVRSVPEPADTPVVPDAPLPDSAPVVPPPPSLASRQPIHRRPPRPRPAETAPVVIAPAPEDCKTPVASDPAQPIAAAPPAPAIQKDESPAQEQPGVVNSTPKRPNRGKRWLKAVGNFLHITHRTYQEEQALRKP